MNKYLTQLARDLSNVSSDDYGKYKIDVYNESTEEKEMIDYVLYIPIPFDLVPVAEKALNNDADQPVASLVDNARQSFTELFPGVLGKIVEL